MLLFLLYIIKVNAKQLVINPSPWDNKNSQLHLTAGNLLIIGKFFGSLMSVTLWKNRSKCLMHCFPDLELMGKCWLKQRTIPVFSLLIYPWSSIIDKKHKPNKTLDFCRASCFTIYIGWLLSWLVAIFAVLFPKCYFHCVHTVFPWYSGFQADFLLSYDLNFLIDGLSSKNGSLNNPVNPKKRNAPFMFSAKRWVCPHECAARE